MYVPHPGHSLPEGTLMVGPKFTSKIMKGLGGEHVPHVTPAASMCIGHGMGVVSA